ncbi:MAG: MMPL family transporter, partial [Ilumatobacteraceae bacterium]
MLSQVARFCVRRRRLVVFGIWIPVIVAVGMMSSTLGSNFSTEFSLPASESSDVQNLLEANAPDRAGFTGQIVFSAKQGVNDPAVKTAMTTVFDAVAQIHGIGVASPYDQPSQINAAGDTAFAQLDISDRSQESVQAVARQIRASGGQSKVEGLTIEYGGYIFEVFELPQSEAFGLFAAIIILVLAFGSVLAMGLPIGTALAGLILGSSVVTIVSNVFGMPDFTTSLVAMIGIGVGIDYALFIVTRYREGLLAGLDVEDAIVEAVDTSGRAVIFAGMTVIISLLGLFLMGIEFARGLAIGAAIGVLFMMLASLTLLPALLGMTKRRIDVTSRAAVIALGIFVLFSVVAVISKSLPLFISGIALTIGVIALSFIVKPLRTPLPPRAIKSKELMFWYRWSRLIQHHPWPSTLGGTA